MGVGADHAMCDVVVKNFTFAITSPDELLLCTVLAAWAAKACYCVCVEFILSLRTCRKPSIPADAYDQRHSSTILPTSTLVAGGALGPLCVCVCVCVRVCVPVWGVSGQSDSSFRTKPSLTIWGAGSLLLHLRQIRRSRTLVKVQGHMKKTRVQQLLRRPIVTEK